MQHIQWKSVIVAVKGIEMQATELIFVIRYQSWITHQIEMIIKRTLVIITLLVDNIRNSSELLTKKSHQKSYECLN